jgi:hypothetical protein
MGSLNGNVAIVIGESKAEGPAAKQIRYSDRVTLGSL